MRRLWRGLGFVLFAAAGCAAPDLPRRPPKPPEELTVPPVADAKFTQPPKYPETVAQDDSGRGGVGNRPNLNAMNTGGMGGMAGRGMGGSGMGGMGGGGMGGRPY